VFFAPPPEGGGYPIKHAEARSPSPGAGFTRLDRIGMSFRVCSKSTAGCANAGLENACMSKVHMLIMKLLTAGLTRIIHEHMNNASVSQSFIRFANKAG